VSENMIGYRARVTSTRLRMGSAGQGGDVRGVTMRITLGMIEDARRADYGNAVRQIEESRRLIERSQALLASSAIQIVRSEEILAEAQRLRAMFNSALDAGDVDSTDSVVTARKHLAPRGW
jgi:hypothetical protein